MKRGKTNSTFSCWKEVGTHYCPLNSSLMMYLGWLMNTQKMILFSKKNPKNLKEADGTDLNIMSTGTKHAFFNQRF